TRKVIAHVRAGDVLALALFGDADDIDRLGTFKQWHRVGYCACRRAATVPTREHALERDAALLDIGDHNDRAPRFEQRPLYHQLFGRSVLALCLTNDGEVKA